MSINLPWAVKHLLRSFHLKREITNWMGYSEGEDNWCDMSAEYSCSLARHGWLHNITCGTMAWRRFTAISCHFRDCIVLLVICITHSHKQAKILQLIFFGRETDWDFISVSVPLAVQWLNRPEMGSIDI